LKATAAQKAQREKKLFVAAGFLSDYPLLPD